MENEKLTFISGGVRSGKSSFAEYLATTRTEATEHRLHYIACGIPFDGEMQERITRHQVEREHSGFEWSTWEKAVNLVDIAHHFTDRDIILLDCVTTLLNNYLFKENITDQKQVIKLIMRDISSLCQQASEVIVVSNEVLNDLPYNEALTLNYQYILGNVHQQIVMVADTAILLESGIPIYKKGR